MTKAFQRAGQALALLSLISIATPASAQRDRQRPAGTAKAGKAKAGTVNRTGAGTAATTRAGKNTNVNVNRNVDVNRNVNVNRDVDVHAWGRAPVRAGRYAWPGGYAYVRRPIGYVLPRAFLAPAYYYSGYAALGLAAPTAGYQWVRYGPDLFLVQVATGQVVDARYGVFAE
ncbi:RcnB family protein [Sphingomonas sp. HDW15A]|uniref:RcnB family protein n=1 Tax=Sphingomonas sp. HDW15A TaxID=2714942 RepID=UPI00140BF5B5|nr:RcnB family protein [Sphingomonas sp. HDW15A]QIK96913.1 RcnB family protein [Sphingomonas sp. HDW15A]